MSRMIALGAAAALITMGAALGMGTAHAGPMGCGTDDDEEYAMAACMNLSGMVGDSPEQAALVLLNADQHGGHITLAQAQAIVRDQVAAGCQNVGR
jgi:hypothetical protein